MHLHTPDTLGNLILQLSQTSSNQLTILTNLHMSLAAKPFHGVWDMACPCLR